MSNIDQKSDGISIEDFADIYSKPEEKDPQKGILDDLEEEVSIEEFEDSKETQEETEEDNPSIESSIINEPVEETSKGSYGSVGSAMRKMIEDGRLLQLDGDKGVDDYSEQDWIDLLEANINEAVQNSTSQAFQEDFENMSPEAKALIQYERNGGKDVKNFMMAIANAKESSDLDSSTVSGQRDIVRAYYIKKRLFKSAASLEKELDRLEDSGDLQEKAEEFKPMLEEIQVDEVNRRLAEQERQKQSLQAQLRVYNESVYNTLNQDNLNGLHITAKTKNMIFNGLTNNGFQTASGKRTNLLYHLLEQKQYIKPDHALIAEVTWLLADPEGYKKAVSDTISKQIVNDTASKLKNEQQGRTQNIQQQERRTLRRPQRNIFER